MKDVFEKFKIPTVLGLGIIVAGIATGVFLVLKEQIIVSKAAPDVSAQNITVSNAIEDSITISYQTLSSTPSFITFGHKSPNETTALDDRDIRTPQPHSIHYFTIKNLLPQTTYQYKIISGKNLSEIQKFTTAVPINQQTEFRPIIGSVLDGNKPLEEGVAYLLIAGTTNQSSLIKSSGNFLIPLSQIRRTDLSDTFSISDETVAKLTIISAKGQANVLFKLNNPNLELPSIKLCENLDLTANPLPSLSPLTPDINKYDLNGDGKVNAADNAVILQNFGKKGKKIAGDLNGDGTVDQKDLDIMSKQINQ